MVPSFRFFLGDLGFRDSMSNPLGVAKLIPSTVGIIQHFWKHPGIFFGVVQFLGFGPETFWFHLCIFEILGGLSLIHI